MRHQTGNVPEHSADDRVLPAVVNRGQDLPDDVLNTRDVAWLDELKVKLAAVQAWRGNPITCEDSPKVS
jgi:hypothetical protein